MAHNNEIAGLYSPPDSARLSTLLPGSSGQKGTLKGCISGMAWSVMYSLSTQVLAPSVTSRVTLPEGWCKLWAGPEERGEKRVEKLYAVHIPSAPPSLASLEKRGPYCSLLLGGEEKMRLWNLQGNGESEESIL